MTADKVGISLCRSIPARILNKGIVRPEIHGHRGAAFRTVGDQLCGNLHPGRNALRKNQLAVAPDFKSLGMNHPNHHFFVVIGLIVALFAALQQAVIALGIKQPVPVKACLWKQ